MVGSGQSGAPARAQVVPPVPRAERAEAEMMAHVTGVPGYVLYQFVRDAKLWGECPEQDRYGLFSRPTPRHAAHLSEAVGHLPDLTEPLDLLAMMVRVPHLAEPGRVAGACRALSRWADARHYLPIALEYAEAAALADPWCAESAADAGQVCFRLSHLTRAVVWYQRAAVLALRTGNWEWYVRTYLRLGFLYFHTGQIARAKPLYRRAAARARTSGRRKLGAFAHHDLLTIAVMEEDYGAAQEHARRAVGLYPLKHPLARLALDYAHLLIRTQHHTRAVMLLEAALPRLSPEPVRMVALGNLALATAAVRERTRFEEVAARVEESAARTEEFASVALMQIGDGARRLALWGRAEGWLSRSMEIAARRQEEGVRALAADVLQRVRERSTLPMFRGELDAEAVREVSREILRRLLRQPGTTDGR